MPDCNSTLFIEAQQYIPGGVNSPVRAFTGMDIPPVFIERAGGKYLYGADGHRYLDFCASWGPLILGHAHPDVVAAVTKAAQQGLSFGAPTQRETELARLVCELVPSAEQVRFVSSGTEAAMTAIRLARGFTGKPVIIKMEGCYHGHSDSLLVKAGSSVAHIPQSSSAGVPDAIVANTRTVPYNDIESLDKMLSELSGSCAAVILEPVPCNMGLVLPRDGYLAAVRECTQRHRALLIFDEVITGFRLGTGGAQELFNIMPDLTVLGKIIGGGMPAGAVAGRRDIMQKLAPVGPVYQAGTLSGNPVAMAAGIATLSILKSDRSIYQRIERLGQSAAEQLRTGTGRTVNQLGSMFTLFMTDAPVTDFASAQLQDRAAFPPLLKKLLARDIYFPPALFETGFISALHTDDDISLLIDAVSAD